MVPVCCLRAAVIWTGCHKKMLQRYCEPQSNSSYALTAAASFAASASGRFPEYTPLTVLPVTPGTSAASVTTAAQSRGGWAALSSSVHGWLKGTVDLISKVVPTAAGMLRRSTHSSATSSRLIFPCDLALVYALYKYAQTHRTCVLQ